MATINMNMASEKTMARLANVQSMAEAYELIEKEDLGFSIEKFKSNMFDGAAELTEDILEEVNGGGGGVVQKALAKVVCFAATGKWPKTVQYDDRDHFYRCYDKNGNFLYKIYGC